MMVFLPAVNRIAMQPGWVYCLQLSYDSRVSLLGFGLLGSVLRTTLVPVVNSRCIQSATNRVITNTWQVLYSPASDQDN